MTKPNKAHTAAVHRIVARYQGTHQIGGVADVTTPTMNVEVETTATLRKGLKKLQQLAGDNYLAVTNKEGLDEALRVAKGTAIGVMDPHGNIVKPCGEPIKKTSANGTGAAGKAALTDDQSAKPAHKRTAAPRLAT